LSILAHNTIANKIVPVIGDSHQHASKSTIIQQDKVTANQRYNIHVVST